MERSCRIILILISISMYDLLFSSGEWIEVNGCHSLQISAIQNKTSLPANEPGVCLQWCGTKTVALQNTICHCINNYGPVLKLTENQCSQHCSGDEKLMCGGNSSDIVSVYKVRRDVTTDWESLNGSGCLTYRREANEPDGKLVPDDCTKKHPFHCYSEMTYSLSDCIRQAKLDDPRTWYEALEACSSRFPLYLWPVQDANICFNGNIQEGIFWVAVYWWTKVIKTSTISSTARTTSSDTATTTTTSSTITMPRSTTSTTSITLSTLTTTETSSQSTNSTMLPPLSISETSTTTAATTSTSSPSTSTSSPTSVSNNWTTITFTDSHSSFTSKNRSASIYITALTNASSISMTSSTSTSTKSTPTHEPPSSANGRKIASSETSSFKTDPPNIGLAHNATTAPLVLQRSDVECQTTSLKIFVPKNLVPGNGTVTWRDSACVVYSNGTHFVDSVGLRDCGTTLTLEADSVVFENDLILHKNGTQMQNGNNIVTYGSDYEFAIPVKCVYPRNSNISTSYIPIVQQVRIMERRNGQLDLTMRQYEAEDYRHPVPFNAYPRQVPLNNDIFIRLAMENNVTGLGLSADNCFATSSPSPVDQNWYQLISSGCPVNNAKIHPSGINDVKFSFHAFNFRLNTSGIVYVHCQVSVCLDTDPACVVGCMTRKKRSASAREGAITSNLISTGPFILAADEGGEAMSTVVAAVSITIAVIATVVAIIGWTRKSKKGADS